MNKALLCPQFNFCVIFDSFVNGCLGPANFWTMDHLNKEGQIKFCRDLLIQEHHINAWS